MLKEKFSTAKQLINEKKYSEARSVLKSIDHPTAREWEAKLDRIAPKVSTSTPPPYRPKVRMQRFWRAFWGILTLLSIAWMCYGLVFTSNVYSDVASTIDSDAGLVGATIGATAGMGIYLCTGVPLFILFVILYWRNGVAIRRDKQHAEMLNVISNRTSL